MATKAKNKTESLELSIVLPCLNEERTVGVCVAKAMNFLKRNKIQGEVIVADNNSTDHSIEIATKQGAIIIHVVQKGYGMALRGGLDAARGKYIIMADSDDSYDLTDLTPFVEKLRAGYDLVMGNRFKGGIQIRKPRFQSEYPPCIWRFIALCKRRSDHPDQLCVQHIGIESKRLTTPPGQTTIAGFLIMGFCNANHTQF